MGWFKRLLRSWLGVEAPNRAPVRAPEHAGFSTHDLYQRADDSDESLQNFILGTAARVIQKEPPKAVAVYVHAEDAAPDLRGRPFVATMDDNGNGGYGLGKASFAMGYGIPDAIVSWAASQSFIGYQVCAILAQNWFIDKACSMPAKDAIRNGYKVTFPEGQEGDPKIIGMLKKLDKRFGVKAHCREYVRHQRIFGIRIMLYKVESPDPDYYLKPFNPDGVTPGSYRGMSQVDPYWITPELDENASADPANIHFYEPTWWRINGTRYHRTHLVITRTCDVPDVLKPTYYYGGIPLPQRLYERCYAAERTANEAPMLALSKRSSWLKVSASALAAKEASITARIQKWARYRDNWGVKIIGDNEETGQVDTALADMDALIMTQFQLACAIAEVPGTKMLGTQPKGFNATGEYEEASYHETLEGIQEHDMLPVIERHHLLCQLSYVVPALGLQAPVELSVIFEDLDAETATEKSARELQDSTRDKNLADTGAIDGIDIRNKLRADDDGPYSGIEEAIPVGPRPVQVVDPGAARAAPNDPLQTEQLVPGGTAPGQKPAAQLAPPSTPGAPKPGSAAS